MSFKYYCTWWIKKKDDLEALTKHDEDFLKIPENVKERSIANKLVGGMYAKYCLLVKELDLCLDQLAQPQKTRTIRKLVESAVFRLKELHNELKWIDFSEYHYIDDALIELKLIPHEIEILHPHLSYPRPFEIQEMYERFKNGEQLYSEPPPSPVNAEEHQESPETQQQQEPPPAQPETTDSKKSNKRKRTRMDAPLMSDKQEELTPEQLIIKGREAKIEAAICLIQIHERARQARLYHFELNRNYWRKKVEILTRSSSSKQSIPLLQSEKEKAAITCQRYYRGYYTRKYLKTRENERRILIGMNEKSHRTRHEFELEEKTIESRRKIRELRIKEYVEANKAEKERLLRVVAPGLAEDVSDEIREWFHQWYLRARTFDKFPTEEKGGTILVVRGETMTPEEWIDEVERKRRAKVKSGGDKEAKEKMKQEKAKQKAEKLAAKQAKLEALRKARKEKRKRRMDVANYLMEFDEPQGKELYKTGLREHKILWDDRDELENPEETHYMDLITDERAYEVQLEVRKTVDEMMRLELELLTAALARDKNRKIKKPKKEKKKKKKGKKQAKDITAHRTTEEIFQELIDNGIIRLYPKTRLDEFFGDMSYNNFELRFQEYMDPPACLGDVRQAITMNCILPLGLEQCKDRNRSVLIVGPPKSGKKILINAIFTSTRCVVFDISPGVLAGKYPGKPGLNMLLHLVMKMARILQPSILYIDDAVKPFYKKVPANEKNLEPKRLGTVLLKKIVKTIKAPDRVMLLSSTNQPWAAKGKMKKVFDKIILIPRSDYGSVYLYWRHLLMPYHGVDRDINLSCIAKLSVNYPLGEIKNVVEQIMTPRRIIELYRKPLTQQELLEVLMKSEPIADKLWKKYTKWYGRTPVGKLGRKFAKNQAPLRADLLRKRELERVDKTNEKKL